MIEALLSLYAPSDTAEANASYGANCGPCSFAALTRREVQDVREFFPSFPEKAFTNLSMMTRALKQAGFVWERVDDWPTNGVALICGDVRYYSRHWVAVSGIFVYEVSLDTWLPRQVWERDFLPELARQSGWKIQDWRLEAGIEVRERQSCLCES